jgi:uncharacterized protein YebE (UPF0316 family)
MNIDILLSPTAWLVALGIFLLRVLNLSLDTVRVLMMIRGRKLATWVLGFIQALIFVYVIGSVLTQLDNILNLIAYSAGFGTGNVVGMIVTDRLALGHIHITIVSSTRGAAITESLRDNGFAVTEIPARGRDGAVSMLHCDILRRNVQQLEKLVDEIDESAFITAEEVRPIRRGFWRAAE